MRNEVSNPPKPPKNLEEAYELILMLWEENNKLRLKVSELEEKLNTNSKNSSKPPSSDPPQTDKKKDNQNNSKKKKRGGQPGHEASQRPLVPVEEVNQIIPCPPEDTCDCGGHVTDLEMCKRHQVFDLPRIEPIITEYQVYKGKCTSCHQEKKGQLPVGTPRGILSARTLAMIGTMSGKYHLSKRSIEEALLDFFGLELCLGSISKSEDIVSQAIKKPVEDAHEYVKVQPVVGADETSLKVGNTDGQNPQGKKGWMWVAVTGLVTVFMINLSRSQGAAKSLLGENFSGILTCDRWGGYNWVENKLKQICWSHLKRDFVKISQRTGESEEIGNGLLQAQKDLFHYWHRVRDGTLKRSSFKVYARFIRQRVKVLLEQGASYPTKNADKSGRAKTSRTCQSLLKLESCMWTFVRVEGVEPTNNTSERAIRPFVMWRKRSYGSQSLRGCHFIERIMTVSSTCKLQKRNVLDYLTQAVEAYLKDEKAPSLLPDTTLPNHSEDSFLVAA